MVIQVIVKKIFFSTKALLKYFWSHSRRRFSYLALSILCRIWLTYIYGQCCSILTLTITSNRSFNTFCSVIEDKKYYN